MKPEEEFLKKHKVVPTLKFVSGEPVRVKILKRKLDVIPTEEGDKEGVKYLVELEEGGKRRFFTTSISLVSQLLPYEDGDWVEITMTKIKTGDGYRTRYAVKKVKESPAPQKTAKEAEEEIAEDEEEVIDIDEIDI